VPERPLLKIPAPESVAPPRPPRGGAQLTKPTRQRQGERLDPKFQRLARVVTVPTQVMQLRQDPEAIAPERAIVFEVAGSLATFYEEAARIGLEYLADDEREIEPDDDFRLTEKPDQPISGRIYLAMPDLEALRQLVRLWERYKAGRRMDGGFGMWTQLFGLLKDVRAWGPEDRLTAETLAAWQEQLAKAPDKPVRFDVELWYRENSETRGAAFRTFSATVHQLGGTIVHHATIPEIRYDAALIDLPAAQIRELIANPTVTLARVNEIMFIRPQSMVAFPVDDERQDDPAPAVTGAAATQPPIAALLDGLPVQNHHRLDKRLIVDDPEGLEPTYLVAARKHGTEMASLIIHGDINRREPPLRRPLYVRPIMEPVRTPNGWEERTPSDRLLVDHVYRAVRRMKEGEADEPPTAPTVFLINLSLGDENRQFSGPMSPWARLLDHLAHRYNVLFLVSAGNVRDSLAVAAFPTWTAFEMATLADRERALFAALDAQKATRTILSPAEAMNVLTVGAAHRDAMPSGGSIASGADPIANTDLPNLSSRLGLGFRKVIKPDLLVDGGREYVRWTSTNPNLHVVPVRQAARAFGLMAAAPDPLGDLSKTALTWGTSAATALATRAGHLVFDAVTDQNENAMLADTPPQYLPLIVKALLVHGSAWGAGASVIEGLSTGRHHAKKDNVSRYVGHGVLDATRIIACTAERATLVGYGEITPGSASLYRIPLPPSLEGVLEPRSVTVTLAWFSPINPRHQGYRMVALDARPGGDPRFSLGVDRARDQPHDKAIGRGTIFHDRREGRRAAPYVDKGDMLLRIAARETAGEFKGRVRYALAVSIEVGVGSTIAVYDEVRAAVLARIRLPVGP
jgi:hypothetical protein